MENTRPQRSYRRLEDKVDIRGQEPQVMQEVEVKPKQTQPAYSKPPPPPADVARNGFDEGQRLNERSDDGLLEKSYEQTPPVSTPTNSDNSTKVSFYKTARISH